MIANLTSALLLAASLVTPPEEAYLRGKFRADASDPATGLSSEELAERGLALAQARCRDGEAWPLAKARVYDFFCRNMRVGADPRDIFPALSCWNRRARPMMKTLAWRDAEINARHLVRECAAVEAAWKGGRFSMWKDFDHSIPPWDELLAGGWPMLDARLRRYERDTPYYRALRLTYDASQHALARFEDAARKAAAKAEDAAGRVRLEREAEAFAQIRRGAPRTAYEALVMMWSYFFLSEHVDGLQVRSLGHLDLLLTPFYRADLAAGRTTPEEFRRDLAHFWWQWGSIDNYWGQPVALGGTRADGTTAFNEVSDLILDVHDALALPTPKMLVKVATNTPERVLNRMLGMAVRHRPITFDGEAAIARSLKSWLGCSDEECRTCDLNGCYEFYVHGAMNATQSSHISFLQPVHDLLARASAGQFAAPAFEDFLRAYRAELRRNTEACMALTDAWERYLGDIAPGNLYTLATETAVRDGRDAFYNGLKYNETALLSVGLGTTVDALLAVKEIVYERREMSLAELGALMAANWKGGEDLRRRMLRSGRKWGNNLPEANALGADLVRTISGWVNGRPNARGGVWGFSGHPARQFIELARHTGATPDGRLAGEEVSKNLSPTPGMDREGVTALVASVAHLRPEDMPVNFTLDVMLHPSAVHGERGIDALRHLMRVYFAHGGLTMQFNVFDAEELRDAQRHPERYANLQVRVCGWNVRWNDLCRAEQDKYIARASGVGE